MNVAVLATLSTVQTAAIDGAMRDSLVLAFFAAGALLIGLAVFLLLRKPEAVIPRIRS